jgi:hypothetical protein
MIPNYFSRGGQEPSLSQETDILQKLRPADSNQEYKPLSDLFEIPPVLYDKQTWENAGKSLASVVADAKAKADESADIRQRNQLALDGDAKYRLASSNMKMGDRSEGNILEMIFRIVPIGINVIRKGKTLVEGLKQTAKGLVNLVRNMAFTAATLAADTISYAFQSAWYNFKVTLCAIGGITNLHKCILFYFIDFVLYLFLIVITSLLFLIDMFFQIKRFVGISCVEMLALSLDGVEKFDEMVHSITGIHPFHYPDMITDMCYTCSALGDTSGYKRARKKMFNDVFVMVPEKIGSPFGDIVRGIGKIFDLFNL